MLAKYYVTNIWIPDPDLRDQRNVYITFEGRRHRHDSRARSHLSALPEAECGQGGSSSHSTCPSLQVKAKQKCVAVVIQRAFDQISHKGLHESAL